MLVEDNAVFSRIIDTGAGLASVTRMPGDFYMIYDAGHWTGVDETMQAIASIVPANSEIDLMILSHSDSDHIGAVKKILEKYTVKKIIRGGLERNSATWKKVDASITAAANTKNTQVINLKYNKIKPGTEFDYGDTRITFVAGFYRPPESWNISGKNSAESRNAGSIVIRLSYKGKSILFTGDAVGRERGAPENTLIATEKYLVKNKHITRIDADVLIAPHHGADNGNSSAFIAAVHPKWVIFSAGHKHCHPTQVTAQRYLNAGVKLSNMFRTDYGDDESKRRCKIVEWDYKRVTMHSDKAHDDDIDIRIQADGYISVEYRNQQ